SPDADVAIGSCRTEGEGSLASTLGEIIKELAGDATVDAIEARLGGDALAEKVASRLATLFAPSAQRHWEDVVLATGRFFESIAKSRPLCVIFDDLHEASTSTINVIDGITDWAEGAPILIVCLARHELLDRRPRWGGGKPNASSLTLGPLSRSETYSLLRQ